MERSGKKRKVGQSDGSQRQRRTERQRNVEGWQSATEKPISRAEEKNEGHHN